MFGEQLGQLQRILAAGIRTGQMQVEGRSASDRARSMYEMILTPEGIVRSVGAEASLALARDTVLHGAMAR